jgi:hypothetical protein
VTNLAPLWSHPHTSRLAAVVIKALGAFGPEGWGHGQRADESGETPALPCGPAPTMCLPGSDLYYLYRLAVVCGVQRRVNTGFVILCVDSTPTRFRQKPADSAVFPNLNHSK